MTVKTKSRASKKEIKPLSRRSFIDTIPGVAIPQIRSANQGLEVATVYRCVNLISDSLSMVPIKILTGGMDQDKTPDRKHWIYRALNFKPNSYESAFVFKKQMFQSLLLDGNAYIIPLNEELHLLDSRSVQVQTVRGSNELLYRVADRSGTSLGVVTSAELLHLRYCTRDGIKGESPILLHREVVQSEDSSERYQRDLLDNRQMPTGIITIPEALDAEGVEEMRRQWATVTRSGRPAVFEMGAKFEQISMTQEQTQFLESRNYTSTDIATKIFGIPPSKVGINNKDGYTLEEQSVQVIDAILPFATIAAEEFRNFFWPEQLDNVELRFDLNQLKRFDRRSLDESYRTGITHGWFNANEAREAIGKGPRPDGENYYVPVNMIDAEYAKEWAKKQVQDAGKVNSLQETSRSLQGVFRYVIRRFVSIVQERSEKGRLTPELTRKTQTDMESALSNLSVLFIGCARGSNIVVGEYVNGFVFGIDGEVEDRVERELERFEQLCEIQRGR